MSGVPSRKTSRAPISRRGGFGSFSKRYGLAAGSLLEAQIQKLAESGTTLLLIAHHEDDLPALVERRFALDAGRLHRTR